MNIHKLKISMCEAERFLRFAADAVKRLETDDMAHITGSKQTAAAKRASLDLTRALAELRKP